MSSCSSICWYLQKAVDTLFSIRPLYLAVALLVAFAAYYYFFKSFKLTLYYQRTERNDYLYKNVSCFHRIYRPTFYLFTGMLQTVILEVFKVTAKKDCGVTYERELVKLDDGGQLSVDWPAPPANFEITSATPLLVVLSGMTGGRKDVYVAKLIRDAFARNCRPILLNQRGLSNTPLTTPKLYSGDMTDDIHRALQAVKRRHPFNPLYAVGFSLGANILANVRPSLT